MSDAPETDTGFGAGFLVRVSLALRYQQTAKWPCTVMHLGHNASPTRLQLSTSLLQLCHDLLDNSLS